MTETSAKHKPEDLIVCVSHSDIIKLTVAYYLGLPLDLFQRLTIAPASISTLHIGEGEARIININHSTSLALPHPKITKKSTKPNSGILKQNHSGIAYVHERTK